VTRDPARTVTILCLLVASFAVAAWSLQHLQLRPGKYPKVQTLPRFANPGEDAFFISYGKDELSHIALFHDFGPSIENARQADILLFGNSRQQRGLREAVIEKEARALGLKAFTIATGHADKTRFALDLIRKHDLRPRVVVASGGPFVFTEGLSPWARRVVSMSRWEAWKYYWESQAAWLLQSRLHRYLPRLDYFDRRLGSSWILYRSAVTGWWRHVAEPNGHYPVSMKAEQKSYKNTLPMARELKQELDQRGALLVLTMVPYRETQSGHLSYLSRELGVPAVVPSFAGMQTADGSHLNRESALRISQDFWDQFITLAPVREKLGLDRKSVQ